MGDGTSKRQAGNRLGTRKEQVGYTGGREARKQIPYACIEDFIINF